MKPLRIVFVTNNYTPYSGGVVSSIIATKKELERLGHVVVIITLDFDGNISEQDDTVFRIFCPVTFLYKKNIMAVPWRPDAHVSKLIKKLKPDLVHSHHPFLLGKSAQVSARAINVPLIFTYHTMYQEYAHYIPLPDRITRFGIMKLVNRYCAQVDHIITPSQAIKDILIERDRAMPVSVVPSGIQSIFYAPETVLEDRSQYFGRFHLLYVGRFVKEKNVKTLLDLFAKLNPNKYIFTLIGYGDEYEALRMYAYDILALSCKDVIFIHKPAQSVIADYYRRANLFLFPSTSDTQGLVLAEAMAGGTPVLAVDGPGQRSIIKEGENGFIVRDCDSMIRIINTISCDRDLQSLLQKGAYDMAQNYTAQSCVKKLEMVYRSFV